LLWCEKKNKRCL